MEVQPGPGIGVLPLELEVADDTGIHQFLLHGRGVLTIDVPVRGSQKSRLRVSARNGGQTISGDPRILDFRVFRIDRKCGMPVAMTFAPGPQIDEAGQPQP
jgi:hypothetical protein